LFSNIGLGCVGLGRAISYNPLALTIGTQVFLFRDGGPKTPQTNIVPTISTTQTFVFLVFLRHIFIPCSPSQLLFVSYPMPLNIAVWMCMSQPSLMTSTNTNSSNNSSNSNTATSLQWREADESKTPSPASVNGYQMILLHDRLFIIGGRYSDEGSVGNLPFSLFIHYTVITCLQHTLTHNNTSPAQPSNTYLYIIQHY
jgi:hypothetical protein